ncbi:hypothetical protein ACW23B_29230 [Streptomyces albidoflavus]
MTRLRLCLATALRYAVLEQVRNRLALALAVFFVPVWVGLAYTAMPTAPVRFFLRAADQDVTVAGRLTQLSGAVHALALIVGFMMFLAARRSAAFDHRLVTAGYPRACLVLAKYLALLLACLLVAGYATAWICVFGPPSRACWPPPSVRAPHLRRRRHHARRAAPQRTGRDVPGHHGQLRRRQPPEPDRQRRRRQSRPALAAHLRRHAVRRGRRRHPPPALGPPRPRPPWARPPPPSAPPLSPCTPAAASATCAAPGACPRWRHRVIPQVGVDDAGAASRLRDLPPPGPPLRPTRLRRHSARPRPAAAAAVGDLRARPGPGRPLRQRPGGCHRTDAPGCGRWRRTSPLAPAPTRCGGR